METKILTPEDDLADAPKALLSAAAVAGQPYGANRDDDRLTRPE